MNTLNSTHSPSPFARILAPIARLSQRVQNSVAKLLGLKDARTASAAMGLVGLTTMAIATVLAGPVAPVIHSAGLVLSRVLVVQVSSEMR